MNNVDNPNLKNKTKNKHSNRNKLQTNKVKQVPRDLELSTDMQFSLLPASRSALSDLISGGEHRKELGVHFHLFWLVQINQLSH